MITINASEEQKKLIFAICELGGISRYNNELQKNILSDKKKASLFISQNIDSFNKTKEKYKINILQNINFEWLLLSLGYQQTDKSSANSKQFRLGKDVINLRLENSENAQIKSDIFNYYIFYTLEDRKEMTPPQIELDNISQQSQKRDFNTQINGTLINFVKDRALSYSEEQILFFLNEIAKDNDKIKQYIKKVNVIDNSFYNNLNNEKVLTKLEKNKNCIKSFEKLKSLEEKESNYEIRGINLNIYSKTMSSKHKIFVVPERIDNYTNNVQDFSTIFFNKTKDSIIKNIVCPIFNINDDGILKIVGFQKNPIINPNIFDIANNIAKEHYHDIMNYIKKEDKNKVCTDEDVIKVYEKLSKKQFPEYVKDSPMLMSIVTSMLKIKTYNGYDEENHCPLWKTELINPTKKKGQGSLGGVAIAKRPLDLNKKQAIAIFENAVFDGFSALQLGYFDDCDVTLVGSLGTITDEFLKEINKMFFMGHPYEKLYIMFDNDEAGIRNKTKIEESFFNEAKRQLLSIVDYDTNKIVNMKNIKEICNKILKDSLYNSPKQKYLLEKLFNIDIISITAKNGKDFNEELLTKKEYNATINIKEKI